METPILTKKQQKLSMSAKKSRPRQTIKNVLSSPYSKYWPLISPEDASNLTNVLHANLPKIRGEKVVIPWQDLKGLSKSERKVLRLQKAQAHETESVGKEDRKGLLLGVNAITRLQETNLASAIIIAGDVVPRLLVQHIIDCAVLHKTPVIVLDNLRSVLINCCGVSSSCLGISKERPSDSKLIPIIETIENIFSKCPPPVNHINYNRSLDSTVHLIDDTVNTDNRESKTRHLLKIDEDAIRSTLYLKRNGQKRQFIPDISSNIMEIDEQYVPLSSSERNSTKLKKQKTKLYKGIKVKRIKGDLNRSRKKIIKLKTK